MRTHARESIAAQTNSAVPCASTRTVAAESGAAAGRLNCAVALWATQHPAQIRPTLPIGKRLQRYLPFGNKDRSAGSTLAAQAASL
jgi:hypothetical protein